MEIVGEAVEEQQMAGRWKVLANWERTTIAATILLCILAATLLSKVLGVPRSPEFSPSLVVQSPAFISLLAALLVMVACAVIGSLFTGHAHHDAGIFAAGIGLATLSVRGGAMGLAYRSTTGSGVFGSLLFEMFLLAAFMFGLSTILKRLSEMKILRDEAIDDVQNPPVEMNHPTMRDKFSALAVQALITLVLATILLRLDSKKQVLTALFITTFIASATAHHLFPIRGGVWFWSGPLVVGFLAYAGSLMSPSPLLMQLGVPPLAIANAAPLDYAGIGVSGALFGYWASRRWHRERAALAQALEEAAIS